MEWLILYRDEHEKEAVETRQMLLVHKIKSEILSVSKVGNMDDESINMQIKNATYCVLFDNQLLTEDKVSFFYGYLIGRVKKFYSLTNEWSKNMEFFKNVVLFSGERVLINTLETQLEAIKAEEKSRDAFASLFNDGIPFTADCFADAVAKNNREVCQRFVDAGIDINCRTKEGTPMLNVAIRAEQNDIVMWLLEKNVSIDAVSNDRGYSAVMDAVWKNNFELTKILIEHGANLNYIGRDGQSVLVLAVGAGKLNICKLLAEAGADPDVKDKMGMSAYEYAKLFGRKDIAEILEKYHKA
ncbi:ankyrin repeat domain-containing protein [Treponema sp.]|uniref:ankyrin repeat domain-containing protein n=1 Tax=Treponema sp. TaxID=166 RepID=UPI00298DAAD5|nr:ankyrin repeat domain-containing protein [Treponema sp.]MCR5612448.1 ankyrin repeat domain-containing protein [Treponema sp.]